MCISILYCNEVICNIYHIAYSFVFPYVCSVWYACAVGQCYAHIGTKMKFIQCVVCICTMTMI